MHGLMESAVYGGRVDNAFDMNVLVAYLKQYFNSETIPGQGKARQMLCDEIQLPNTTDFQVSIALEVQILFLKNHFLGLREHC